MIKKEQWEILIQNLKIGMNKTDSCVLAGISRQAFYNKMGKDKKLKKRVNEAELEPKKRAIGLIQKAAVNGNWQSAAWWLERKYSDEFAIKQAGDSDKPLNINIKMVDADNRTKGKQKDV